MHDHQVSFNFYKKESFCHNLNLAWTWTIIQQTGSEACRMGQYSTGSETESVVKLPPQPTIIRMNEGGRRRRWRRKTKWGKTRRKERHFLLLFLLLLVLFLLLFILLHLLCRHLLPIFFPLLDIILLKTPVPWSTSDILGRIILSSQLSVWSRDGNLV